MAALAAILAQAAGGPDWIAFLVGFATLGAFILAALRLRPESESRLYGDAMKMVAELKAQLAAETAKRETLELQLVEAKAERFDLEQRMVKLYTRIELLEAQVGGRRTADG